MTGTNNTGTHDAGTNDAETSNAEAPTKFEQTHISIVLDRSGSMESCAVEAIGSVNAYLANARKDDALKESDLELTIFDSVSIDTIRTGAPIALADITRDDYQPRGGTPLNDAIGRGIDSLDARTAKSGSGKAILVVMTDGMENASRKYGHSEIAELIKARQDKGWLVMFLGAGLDAARQGAALGVRLASTASIAKDGASLRSVAGATYSMSASYACAGSAQEFLKTEEASFSDKARADMGDKSAGAGLVADIAAGFANPAGIAQPPEAPKASKTSKAKSSKDDTWTSGGSDAWSR
jgi:uncharacterized protein YegL